MPIRLAGGSIDFTEAYLAALILYGRHLGPNPDTQL